MTTFNLDPTARTSLMIVSNTGSSKVENGSSNTLFTSSSDIVTTCAVELLGFAHDGPAAGGVAAAMMVCIICCTVLFCTVLYCSVLYLSKCM